MAKSTRSTRAGSTRRLPAAAARAEADADSGGRRSPRRGRAWRHESGGTREWIDPRLGQIRLREFWEWLEPILGRRIRPTTLALYRGLWRRHLDPELGDYRLVSLTRFDIEEFIARRSAAGVRPATLGAAVRLLHRILEAAVDSRRIVANPARGVGQPALPHSEMRFLMPEEVERLVACTPLRWRAFVILAAWCGLRFGEIAALKVERVDFLRRQIRVEETLAEVGGRLHIGPPKTKAKRSVAVPPFVVEAVAEHIRRYARASGGLVFTSPKGGPVRELSKPGLGAGESGAGLDSVRFHDLRHTAVALAIAAGGHAKAIQARLGHSSVAMTLDRYGHLMEGLDGDVAMRLEKLHQTAWRRPARGGAAAQSGTGGSEKASEQGV